MDGSAPLHAYNRGKGVILGFKPAVSFCSLRKIMKINHIRFCFEFCQSSITDKFRKQPLENYKSPLKPHNNNNNIYGQKLLMIIRRCEIAKRLRNLQVSDLLHFFTNTLLRQLFYRLSRYVLINVNLDDGVSFVDRIDFKPINLAYVL